MNIFILHSNKTQRAANDMIRILGAGKNAKVKIKTGRELPSNLGKYDGFVYHNRLDIKPDLPCAIYACSGLAYKLIKGDEKIPDKAKVIWTNTHTAAQLLREKGKSAIKCMIRPRRTLIPKECPTPPTKKAAKKTILWYWKKDWYSTDKRTSQIVGLMNQLSDFKILVVSNSLKRDVPEGVDKHVIGRGRMNLPDHRDEFIGMVRATREMDFGRVTYQVQALGKWCLYVSKPNKEWNEPFVPFVRHYKHIPKTVRELSKNWGQEEYSQTYNYIKQKLNKKALRESWEKEFFRVFG